MALGGNIGYHDCETVDQIVARLDAENGKFSALLMGIVDSAPFQKRRLNAAPPAAGSTAKRTVAWITLGP